MQGNTRALITLGRKAAERSGLQTLTVDISVGPDGKLPTEVRLFKAGANPTRKGEFLFDAEAAKSVMAAYAEHGVDVMIDLEHMSLDDEAPNYDPDARGYGRLELRADGELWLVGISWTQDGVDRVSSRRQRFVSPAFEIDDERRITQVFNVAITSMPATDDAMPLAASARRHEGMTKMDPKLLNATALKFDALVREGKAHKDIVALAGTDMKTLQAVVKALGGDPTADLGTLFGIVQDFAKSLTEMASGKKAEADKPEEPSAEGPPAMMIAQKPAELETLRQREAARAESDRRELVELRRKDAERDATERHELTAALVVCRKFNPADVWDDDDAKTPQEWLRAMPIEKLRAMVKRSGGSRVPADAPKPPTSSVVTSGDGICEMSEYESKRLRAQCEKHGTKYERAEALYLEHKGQQVLGARAPDVAKRLGRKIEQHMALAGSNGRFGRAEFVTLSSPVTPIQDFSGASQRALEEFRIEFLGALASMPEVWAETFGQMLPGGSLRDTYPLDFEAVVYAERTAGNAVASTPESAEITVDKHEYRAAKQAQLRRIQQGDFAYVKTWQNAAATMATARVHLRNMLVAHLLEDGDSTVWGVSAKFPSGIDGANFFSATHKVNPFGGQTFLGSSTWLNLQAAATPLNATHLTEEKAASLLVPAPNGQFIGGRSTHMLLPLCLDETARLLLTVQDIILDSAGAVGVSNEHKGSGFGHVMGPELAGSGATADYYLMSQERIARGMVPWVVAEDAAEEVLTWDESSDFYKDTGLVKVESKIYCNAALVYPHGIRKIKGA